MHEIKSEGETSVAIDGAPRRCRFTVRLVHRDRMRVSLEDLSTGDQWQTRSMTVHAFHTVGAGWGSDNARSLNRLAQLVVIRLRMGKPWSPFPFKPKPDSTKRILQLNVLSNFYAVVRYGVDRQLVFDRVHVACNPLHQIVQRLDEIEARSRDWADLRSDVARPTCSCALHSGMAHHQSLVASVLHCSDSSTNQLMRCLTLSSVQVGTSYTFDWRFLNGITGAKWQAIGDNRETYVRFYHLPGCRGTFLREVQGQTGEITGEKLSWSSSFLVTDAEFEASWFTRYRRRSV